VLRFENLHKRFGKLKVLKGLDLEIAAGGIFAVLGPNGSGKTTLIKSVLGMVVPEQGKIFIDGEDVVGQWAYREAISYLPQIANFPNNMNVRELIATVKSLRRTPSDERALIELFGLQPFLKKKLSTLSGGTKQKVNIVLTFMFDSPLIILDEPTTGLDPLSLVKLKELIAQRKAAGRTILVTTHIMSLVEEIADGIVFLLDGLIYFNGTLEALEAQTQQPTLERAIASILEREQV
jgi:Cu-processing system ATP-binding protein